MWFQFHGAAFFVNVNNILHSEDYSTMFEIYFIKSAFTENSDFEKNNNKTSYT